MEVNNDLIVQLVANLGIGGVLVWYLYYTTTKTIPDIVDKHNTTIERISTQFTATIEKERVSRENESERTRQVMQRVCSYRTPNGNCGDVQQTLPKVQ